MRRQSPVWIGTWTLPVAALLSALSCGGAPDGVVDKCTEQLALPPSVTTDILFVIDNSDSMGEEQAKVVAQLRGFVDSLASGTVQNDFQIGVITSSVSMNYLEACPPAASRFYEYSSQAGRLQLGTDLKGNTLPTSTRKLLGYQDPDLINQCALLVGQGVVGAGQEMPFEAVRRALTPPLIDTPLDAVPPGNRGLLRAGARLLVVVVSDEDDCSDVTGTAVALEMPTCGSACTTDSTCTEDGSYCLLGTTGRTCARNACETVAGRAALTPVANYVEFLKGLDDGTGTGRKREVYLAVIGPVDSSGKPARCQSSTDQAYGSGVRMVQAVTAMGDHGLISSICADDYGATLQQIAELVREPQVLDLANDPVDGRLLVVEIHRAGEARGDGGAASSDGGGGTGGVDGGVDGPGSGESVTTCRMGDGFSFAHATATTPARVTMEGRCRLHHGDRLTVRVLCAE